MKTLFDILMLILINVSIGILIGLVLPHGIIEFIVTGIVMSVCSYMFTMWRLKCL